MKPILKAGCLAYFDSFAGLVPCKVLRVSDDPDIAGTLVQITADRGAYKRGTCECSNVLHTIPRECIRRSRYKCSILPYDVEVTR